MSDAGWTLLGVLATLVGMRSWWYFNGAKTEKSTPPIVSAG